MMDITTEILVNSQERSTSGFPC